MIPPIKHKTLFHWFKRESVGAISLNKYLQAYPQTNRNLGTLPYDWLKSFPTNERKNVTIQVQDLFASFSKDTSNIAGYGQYSGWSFVDCQQFEQGYKNLVRSLKEILKRKDIKIKYAGSGALKNCHRLDIGKYSYALSSFRDETAAKIGFGGYYKPCHGRGYEPQNALTAYKRASQGRWTKPFMIRISDSQDKGGYILSKFVDKQQKTKFGIFQKKCDYFINADESDDIINNINTDIGGCFVNESYIKDSVVRHAKKYFAKMLDNNIELCEQLYATKVQKYLLEQKQQGLDILSPEYMDILKTKLNSQELSLAIKQIKSLRKIRIQKEKLQKLDANKFEKVKSLLEKDIKSVYIFDRYRDRTEDFIRRLKTYPVLVADELGLSHFPVLDGWMTIFQEYGRCIDFSCMKDKFTSSDISKFIKANYEDFKMDKNLLERLKESFQITI